MDILIRNIPEATAERIQAAADNIGQSRQEFLTAHLERHFGMPPIVYGYVRIDRHGDLDVRDDDLGDDCPECGQSLWEPYLRFASDGTFGVVCSGCATSE